MGRSAGSGAIDGRCFQVPGRFTMRRSSGFRLFVVGVLALLMYVPLFLVGSIVDSRASYNRQTIAEVGREWGGPQTLVGPVLVIPVEGPREVQEAREIEDAATGERRVERTTRTVIVPQAPIHVLPETLDMQIDTATEERRRGIFVAPVYRAEITAAFGFSPEDATALLDGGEVALWDRAEVRLQLSSNAALRGETTLARDAAALVLEPRADGTQGVFAAVGDPREGGTYRLRMGLNGAQQIFATPVARQTVVRIGSDWPHPSFSGAFLPDGSDIGPEGFEARWTIPYLARAVPHLSRNDFSHELERLAFGVRFFQPNDFYQKAWRAANYGLLFLGLTFLTVFLIESRSSRPAHPVQYILIGLAQAVFVLLMVAYAEQIGFGPAYLISAAATVGLLTLYALLALRLGMRALVLGVLLSILYGVLYLILESTDYALLAGATLSFLALAATMWATRNEDWYGPDKAAETGAPTESSGFWGQRRRGVADTPSPAASASNQPDRAD